MELIILIAISIIQSVIGVGILLFGTPIFLLMGYTFFETLVFLLPISIVISLMTIIQNGGVKLRPNSVILVVIFIIIGTYFAIEKIQDFSILIIALTLIVTFILNLISSLKITDKLFKEKNIILSFIGLLHGITNQGGALLLWFFNSTHESKVVIRGNIAMLYGIMATFQLLTLLSIDTLATIKLLNLNNIVAPITSFFIGAYFFKNISGEIFKQIVNAFIGIFGISLLYKFIFS